MKSFMFRLPVVGSTLCGLFLSVCLVQAANAEIINLEARYAAFDSPVEVFLDAGTYSVTPVGIVGGGTYDAWTAWSAVNCGNPLGCTQTSPTTATGYLTEYVVISDALESVTVDGAALNRTAVFPTPTIVSIFASGAPYPWGGTWYRVRPAIVYPDAVSALASATTSTFTLDYAADVGFATGDLWSASGDNSGGISLLVVPVVLKILIDIKPGSDPNSINLCSNGAVPIAILGSETFDVYDIDITTLRFAEASVKVVGKKDPNSLCSYEDVNEDIYYDLVCHFVTADIAGVDGESSTATVNGELLDGAPIEGTDSINIVKDTCN